LGEKRTSKGIRNTRENEKKGIQEDAQQRKYLGRPERSLSGEKESLRPERKTQDPGGGRKTRTRSRREKAGWWWGGTKRAKRKKGTTNKPKAVPKWTVPREGATYTTGGRKTICFSWKVGKMLKVKVAKRLG